MNFEQLSSKQREIVDISLDLFQRKGYAGSSMRDIAEVMNIKAASLYSHIKSKEEIFFWICADLTHRFRKAAENVALMGGTPKEMFLNMTKAHLKEVFHNVKQYDVFFTNIYSYQIDFSDKSKFSNEVFEYIVYLENIIKNYLNALQINPIIEQDVVLKFSVSALNSFYRWKKPEDLDIEKDSEFLHQMLVFGVSGK